MSIVKQFTTKAKINLYLDIIDKDPIDNYHYLESIITEINWGDEFSIRFAEKDSIKFTNYFDIPISSRNTVSVALELFKNKFQINDQFSIHIKKNIPMGAGLGGGSGDAGYLLRNLCDFYKLPINDCIDIAQKVGSDVPFFLHGNSALIEGKGEKITSVNGIIDPKLHILIIYPNIYLSTKEAFRALNNIIKKDTQKNCQLFLKKAIWTLDFLKEMNYNIFDNYIGSLSIELLELKQFLDKAISPDLIFLTGSGSSFVLLYQDQDKLQKSVSYINNMKKQLTYFIQSN